ncbi:hypothetical protein EDB83DRAFT_2326963 [Lactarius deliciosus]|nr:hypothetical protein EDB83DRAFT_2326963 [Lactarius deliciosus]
MRGKASDRYEAKGTVGGKVGGRDGAKASERGNEEERGRVGWVGAKGVVRKIGRAGGNSGLAWGRVVLARTESVGAGLVGAVMAGIRLAGAVAALTEVGPAGARLVAVAEARSVVILVGLGLAETGLAAAALAGFESAEVRSARAESARARLVGVGSAGGRMGRVGSREEQAGERWRAGDAAAELRKLPGRLEEIEMRGEEGGIEPVRFCAIAIAAITFRAADLEFAAIACQPSHAITVALVPSGRRQPFANAAAGHLNSPWSNVVFKSPVARTAKRPEPDRTATGCNRTYGSGPRVLGAGPVAVLQNPNFARTATGPVGTGPNRFLPWFLHEHATLDFYANINDDNDHQIRQRLPFHPGQRLGNRTGINDNNRADINSSYSTHQLLQPTATIPSHQRRRLQRHRHRRRRQLDSGHDDNYNGRNDLDDTTTTSGQKLWTGINENNRANTNDYDRRPRPFRHQQPQRLGRHDDNRNDDDTRHIQLQQRHAPQRRHDDNRNSNMSTTATATHRRPRRWPRRRREGRRAPARTIAMGSASRWATRRLTHHHCQLWISVFDQLQPAQDEPV